MCGLNAVDMYQLDPILFSRKRLEYNKSKTREIRDKKWNQQNRSRTGSKSGIDTAPFNYFLLILLK